MGGGGVPGSLVRAPENKNVTVIKERYSALHHVAMDARKHCLEGELQKSLKLVR